MNNKEHKLKTVKEIIDVITLDNIEVFKKDFCAFLDMSVMIKELQNKFSKDIKIDDERTEQFHWIDDGKNDITFNIEVKTE